MAKKEVEPKVELEREYTVPLRKGWLKVPEYKRTNKAVKTLKEFLVRHMRLYDNDLRKIKLDVDLNNEIRFRGIKKPPAKIKVKAKKFDDGIVRVELVEVPKHIKFARLKEKKVEEIKKKEEAEKKEKEEPEDKTEKKESKEKTEKKPEKKEIEKKKESVRDEGLKLAKDKAKEQKHVSKDKDVRIQRKALSR